MSPIDINTLARRIDAIERNHTMLASSLTKMVEELEDIRKPLDDLRLDRAARLERDKGIHERFDRVERSLKGIHGIGWWLLTAAGSTGVAFLMSFILSGGLDVTP